MQYKHLGRTGLMDTGPNDRRLSAYCYSRRRFLLPSRAVTNNR